jgi:hypothetical protein
MKQFRNQLGPLAVGVVVLAGLVYAFLPAPVPVELATVTCGPIERVVIEDGRARPQTVTVGLRNDLEAQVVEGLQEGDQVVVHPSDRVRNGVRVRTVK